jgi:hypothetical protein
LVTQSGFSKIRVVSIDKFQSVQVRSKRTAEKTKEPIAGRATVCPKA